MKNRRTSLLALVLGAGILMGHPGTASAQTETSVFEIEYMDEEAVYNVLRLFGAGSTFDTNSRTVVVGKASVGSAALILVMSAQIVE